ncbi:glycosyltransferase family 39 protein [Telmatobacter sp. DSM 110680]|uniref:Glycosyltransferase family 39 protein n=1 Tax=Telmatobacter sp. DSM 110680 TaxID=3036704 RepID=A0AAU7DSS3_9BACT
MRAAFWILAALLAGALLRFWMLKHFYEVTGDALIYGGIAKNLLLYGRYALTVGTGETYPTLIRLPGYPLFLSMCFKLFGMENYAAAAWAQIVLELAGCLLLADFARHVAPARLSRGAAFGTLWLAVLCPFTAVYAANPLTEGPTLFAIALAMWSVVQFAERPGWRPALGFTFAVTYAALLRPDGALVALAFAPSLLVVLRRKKRLVWIRGGVSRMMAVCVLLAVVPFAAWTWRNWRTFHVIEPLAPRYATDPGESTQAGWISWVKTWCLDFVSTYEVYWNVPGDTLDISKLPPRAFDSQEQYAETAALANAYNNSGQSLTPEIDARFAKLAAERSAAHPLRSHVLLPLGRVLDMWLRPRVENLPIDLDWWVYKHHYAETRFSWFYAGLNALYLLLGIAGLCMRPKMWPWMLAYMMLRSALLLTVEAPEARYTLECFPMLFVLGGIALYRLTNWVLLSVPKAKASAGRG